MKRRVLKVLALMLTVAFCLSTFAACGFKLPEELDEPPQKEQITRPFEAKPETEVETEHSDAYTKGLVFERDRETDEYAVVGYEGSAKNVTVPAIYLGKPVTVIAKNAFFKSSVEEVRLPDSIRIIGENAFKSSDELKEVYVGSQEPQLEKIDKDAFFACKNLEYIYYFGTGEEWDQIKLGKNWDKNAGSRTDTKTYSVYCVEDDGAESVFATESEAVTEIDSDTESGSDTETVFETVFETESETESDSDTESESITESNAESDSESMTEGGGVIDCEHPNLLDVSKDPTCVDRGSVEFHCPDCGYHSRENVIALGHDEIQHEAKEPTCTDVGWDSYVTCSRCDYSTYNEKEATGHTSDADATCTEDQTCTVCGITLSSALGHSEIDHNAKAPTCTDIGWDAYVTCSRCDYTTYDEIKELGHTNKTVGKCERCDYTIYSEGLEFTSNNDGTCYVSGIGSCNDKDVWIPETSPAGDKVTSIGDSAFIECTSLMSIQIPDSITSIGLNAFTGCSSLKSIIVDENNTVYHSEGNCLIETASKTLIAGCENSVIPANGSVTIIDDFAFYSCTSLANIVIPDGVTSIGNYVFGYCSSLTSITIPDSVTSIGERAFEYCSSLTSIEVDANNKAYHSAGNCLIETASKILISGCKNSVIPADGSVTSIGDSVFFGCTSLTSIEIPDNVTSIGDWAFFGCTSLTSIEIPDNVTSIGYQVFCDCSSLTSVEILECVTNIDGYAFSHCRSLTSIEIPDNVTSIGEGAFFDCSSLTSITIPEGVTSIGERAFLDCLVLETVYYTGTEEEWAAISIGSNNDDLENANIVFPAKGLEYTSNNDGTCYVSGIGSCSDKDIFIPKTSPSGDTVIGIGVDAFYGCGSITGVVIQSGVTSIDNFAFQSCTSLESVVIPNSVVSIGYMSFDGCESLTGIYIPDSVTEIGDYAFEGCTSLESVVIPGSVTSLGEGAFYDCEGLKSVVISGGITSIGDYAFGYCLSLESVTLSSDVTSIGEEAFYDCESLETVYYSGTEAQWAAISIATGNDCLKNANVIFVE